MREDKELEKVYFYIPPYCHSLKNDKDTRISFNSSVNRISVKSKVTTLAKQSS